MELSSASLGKRSSSVPRASTMTTTCPRLSTTRSGNAGFICVLTERERPVESNPKYSSSFGLNMSTSSAAVSFALNHSSVRLRGRPSPSHRRMVWGHHPNSTSGILSTSCPVKNL